MGKYNTAHLKAHCEREGLVWDQDLWIAADLAFRKAGLNQEQVEIMVKGYIKAVKYLFDASGYSIIQRIAIAFHFILGRKIRGRSEK